MSKILKDQVAENQADRINYLRVGKAFAKDPASVEATFLADFQVRGYGLDTQGAGIDTPLDADELFDTTRSTVKNVFDKSGKLVEVPPNTPAYTYDPVTGAPLGISIEPSATNLVTYSEDFSNVFWTKINLTTSVNTETAPDGELTADSFEATVTGQSRITANFTGSAATDYALSVHAKGSNTGSIGVGVRVDSTFDRAIFNLTDGTIDSSAFGSNVKSASIEELSDGWFRLSIVFNIATLGATNQVFFAGGNGFITTIGDTFTLWGAQLEAGSFPTSYIRTEASTVTRAADVVKTDSLVPWFNGGEGSYNLEVSAKYASGTIALCEFSDGTSANSVATSYDGTNISFRVDTLGARQITLNVPVTPEQILDGVEVRVDYTTSSASLEVVGIGTDSGSMTAFATGLDTLSLGTNDTGSSGWINGNLATFKYYPSAGV